MISSLPSTSPLVIDTVHGQLNDVGSGGKRAYFIPKVQCYICLSIFNVTNADWKFDSEIFKNALSVQCDNYINGICKFVNGKPKVFEPTTAAITEALLQPWDAMILDPKLEDFAQNDSLNGIALTSGDVGEYWGVLIESYIQIEKQNAQKLGQLELWNDTSFEAERRRSAADTLDIPILKQSPKCVWGYDFEILHCTGGIGHNYVIKTFRRCWIHFNWHETYMNRLINKYGLCKIYSFTFFVKYLCTFLDLMC